MIHWAALVTSTLNKLLLALEQNSNKMKDNLSKTNKAALRTSFAH